MVRPGRNTHYKPCETTTCFKIVVQIITLILPYEIRQMPIRQNRIGACHISPGGIPWTPASVAASMQHVAFASYALILAPSALALARRVGCSLLYYVLFWICLMLFSSLWQLEIIYAVASISIYLKLIKSIWASKGR